VHTLQICPKNDFEAWEAGELVYDSFGEAFVEVPKSMEAEEFSREDYCRYTFDEFFNGGRYETFCETYTTEEHNDEIVIFGYYGYDG